jgi:hypothetical protein
MQFLYSPLYCQRTYKIVKHLHLFSDACPCQNCNNPIIILPLFLVETGKLEAISHYPPIRGHFVPPFWHRLRNNKEKIKFVDTVFTVKGFLKIIVNSSTEENFHVQTVTSDNIFASKYWWPRYYKNRSFSYEPVSNKLTRDKNKPVWMCERFTRCKNSHLNKYAYS